MKGRWEVLILSPDSLISTSLSGKSLTSFSPNKKKEYRVARTSVGAPRAQEDFRLRVKGHPGRRPAIDCRSL